jgi:Flp pilus assembly secretin CpaC
MRHSAWLIAAALFIAVPFGAIAQQTPASPAQQTPVAPAQLELKPGFTTLIQFSEPIRTLTIGNPEIADVAPLTLQAGGPDGRPPPVYSDRTYIITAKTIGETNLIAVNQAQQAVYRGTLLVGGGEIGRLTVHSKKTLHEYWTYRCSEYNCQRFGDKFERQPAPPIFLVPPSTPTQEPGAAAPAAQ